MSYFSTWQSIVALILLDYIVAFGVFALSGIFKRVERRQNYAVLYGILLASVLRYICHVISGATIWAGLSIPTNAALLYSLSYNATYMIPETIILVSIGIYLTSMVDFTKKVPARIKKQSMDTVEVYSTIFSGLVFVITVVIDVLLIAPYLQDPESGEFVFTNLTDLNAAPLLIVSIIGIVASVALFVVSRLRKKQN